MRYSRSRREKVFFSLILLLRLLRQQHRYYVGRSFLFLYGTLTPGRG